MGRLYEIGWDILPRDIEMGTFKKIVWEILPRKIKIGIFRKLEEKYYHVKLKWGYLEYWMKNITTWNWNGVKL